MHKNHVEIIAGRPSTGKTLLASQICRENVNYNRSILYFSLELATEYLIKRFGIPKEVLIIDDPNLDWKDIRDIIIEYQPDETIIDYLQLVQHNNSNLINIIIEEHNNFTFNNYLYILSQVALNSIVESRKFNQRGLLKANIEMLSKKISFTALTKTRYQLH
jgi:replicative DNA helicase